MFPKGVGGNSMVFQFFICKLRIMSVAKKNARPPPPDATCLILKTIVSAIAEYWKTQMENISLLCKPPFIHGVYLLQARCFIL